MISIRERLAILAQGARYDASCASSGVSRRGRGGLGTAVPSGICHSWSSDGRCESLLKLLLTNACIYDCAYCVNRRSNDLPRASLTPDEVADLTVSFYRRNYVEGLFLSTGVVGSPDYAMELLIETARTLRQEHRFHGYVHLKVIPGTDPMLVERAGRYADRVSVNIELPTARSLGVLAPDKTRETILGPMEWASSLIARNRDERKALRSTPPFAPAGQSTQLIVGATPEGDLQILRVAEGLYRKMALERVYYSAFLPVSPDPRLPPTASPPLLREHRLYQADWLLRFYSFEARELVDETAPDLDLGLDPKLAWALRNLDRFPVEVNRVDYEMLLRVPGIGVRSARRILRARRAERLGVDDLKRLGLAWRRARHFVTVKGKYTGDAGLEAEALRRRLAARSTRAVSRQLELFGRPDGPIAETVTGEL